MFLLSGVSPFCMSTLCMKKMTRAKCGESCADKGSSGSLSQLDSRAYVASSTRSGLAWGLHRGKPAVAGTWRLSLNAERTRTKVTASLQVALTSISWRGLMQLNQTNAARLNGSWLCTASQQPEAKSLVLVMWGGGGRRERKGEGGRERESKLSFDCTPRAQIMM